jgi:dTDP-4-amino-4,6-dideoxygalactose transaminase
MIPFNVPYVPKISIKYVKVALKSNHQHGDGPFEKKTTALLSDMFNGSRVFLTPSCTHALELSCMLVGIRPGDEVILPSYNFTSAATAVTKFGGIPIFVDIDKENLCINTSLIEPLITERTKAILWVNYAGASPNIDELIRIKKKYGLMLIEDNAHGLGGTYKGAPLGTFGDFATLSFHSTKNIQCGEGGAIIMNNSSFIDQAEVIREKGTNRSEFNRNRVNKYQWVGPGSSYLMNEVTAAVLLGQIESFSLIQTARQRIFQDYSNLLRNLVEVIQEIELPRTESILESSHIFYVLTKNQDMREKLISRALKAGIHLTSHYQPLHNSPAGRVFTPQNISLPVSLDVSSRIVRFPIWVGLKVDHKIIRQIMSNA